MSDLTRKGEDKHNRKPFTYLTGSQANRKSTPSSHTQVHPSLVPSIIAENVQVQQCLVLYSPPRPFPGEINRPWLYTKFNGSSHYGYGPDTSHQVPYPQKSKYGFHRDKKRHKTDSGSTSRMMREPNSSFRPDMNHRALYTQGQYGYHQENNIFSSVSRESRHTNQGWLDQMLSTPAFFGFPKTSNI